MRSASATTVLIVLLAAVGAPVSLGPAQPAAAAAAAHVSSAPSAAPLWSRVGAKHNGRSRAPVAPRLANSRVAIEFGQPELGFPVVYVGLAGSRSRSRSRSAATNLLDKPTEWWHAEFVSGSSEGTPAQVGPAAPCASRSFSRGTAGGKQTLTLAWGGIGVAGSAVNVTAVWALGDNESVVELTDFSVSPASASAAPVAVWNVCVALTTVAVRPTDTLFLPFGCGLVFPDPATLLGEAGWLGFYPSTLATMQWLMQSAGGASLYFATHDANASSKTFVWSANPAPHLGTATVGVLATPRNASLALSARGWRLGFPVSVGVLASADWWDGAAVYRAWAVRSARWLRSGPLASRADVPAWALGDGPRSVEFWVNAAHAPAVMATRMASVSSGLGLGSLGVHWYDWGQYPMDTHFPDYGSFQPGLVDALAKLKAAGVRTLPYTNARVFDLNHSATDGWDADGAERWSLKRLARPALQRAASATLPVHYEEEYEGPSGVHFAPMCPATVYWQNKTAATAARLASAGFDGVYLDQVAEAAPEPCFDPRHGHPIGGGSHWSDGYAAVVRRAAVAAAGAQRAGADGPPLVAVESNAEAEMDAVGAYLTWLAFGEEDQRYTCQGFFVNAFAAVNGGFFAGFGGTFGKAWEVLDFHPRPPAPPPAGNADGLAAKLAWQALSGVAMGWASDGPGPWANGTGVVNWLLRPEGAAEAAWLRRLAWLRRAASPFVVHGRRWRDVLPPDPTAANRTFGPIRLPSLQAQAWVASDGGSLAVLVAAVQSVDGLVETLRLRLPAGVVRASGDVGATAGTGAGLVLQEVTGSWTDGNTSAPVNETTVASFPAGAPVVFDAALGPRALRFFRVVPES